MDIDAHYCNAKVVSTKSRKVKGIGYKMISNMICLSYMEIKSSVVTLSTIIMATIIAITLAKGSSV
jgi:hypothetical protein